MTTTFNLSFPPSDLRFDEIDAADALLCLSQSPSRATTSSDSARRRASGLSSGRRFPRWGSTKRRSIPKSEDQKNQAVERLSPSTPLLFSPSGGDETPPPPPAHPLPVRPPARIARKVDRHKEWVKEQKERIATLSAANASLQQCVSEARSRYQILREANSSLKKLQSTLRQTIIQRRRRQLLLVNNGSWRSELDVPSVGPVRLAGYQHERRQLDLNRSLDAEAGAAAEVCWRRRQQRAAAYAQARKRRMELQRVKSSSLRIQRLR